MLNLNENKQGVGPSVAWKLYKKGISSIEDLKNHSELLTEHQKIGLKYEKYC